MSILPIDNLNKYTGGGKAYGISLLKSYSMNTPLTFLVREYNEPALIKFLDSLPSDLNLAVRSSAVDEDGPDLSFAGQYESILNLHSKKETLSAIRKCLNENGNNKNSTSYKKQLNSKIKSKLFVLLQEMVNVDISGVVFTADPVENRRDTISITITNGLGDKLMGGMEDGEQITFLKHNCEKVESRLIPKKQLYQLINEAKTIENQFGKPVDLEWAIDKSGRLWWLQLRPITSLAQANLNELDNKPLYKKPIYTRGNIGEMMPGPVTPLTLSTFAKAIDRGLQVFYDKTGSQEGICSEMLFVHSYYNHLFFDMHRLYESVRRVGISKKENIDFSIVGHEVENVEVEKNVKRFRAVYNSLLMIKYIKGARKSWKRLRRLNNRFRLSCPDNIEDCYYLIHDKLYVLNKAYGLHYVTSSQSGALYAALLAIFADGKAPQIQHHQMANSLFSDIPDVESAEVIKSLDNLARTLPEDPLYKSRFVEAETSKALEYLEKTGPEKLRNMWEGFIKRHGHRCVREAEMFEKEWAADPSQIIELLKVKSSTAFQPPINGKHKANSHETDELNGLKKLGLNYLLPKARKAVARREQTKAWSIRVQNEFKSSYRHLANLLVNKNLLFDKDHIFFLTHEEIGHLIIDENKKHWMKLARDRYNLYPEMKKLQFNDLIYGIPFPVEMDKTEEKPVDGKLHGIPVSRGEIISKVRIVNEIADAYKLKKGEIMVAKFTDVGWTPYYGLISGLITEIGSPLSHGAVVAREYGLPAIVSLKGATSLLKTGQKIKMDAVKGTVEILNDNE
jgi:pyruvate,water dikinase